MVKPGVFNLLGPGPCPAVRELSRNAVRPLRSRLHPRHRPGARSLAASEAQLRFFFEQSPEGIWSFDLARPLPIVLPEPEQLDHLYRHARVTECNPAMARMQGFEQPGDLLGACLGDFFPPGDPRRRHLPAFVRSGYRLIEAESQEADREGRSRYFIQSLLGRVEGGKLVSAWGTQLDVSERRLLEEELKRGAEELLAADRHKDEFLAVLGHELRNPLAPLRNAAEMMRGGTAAESVRRRAGEIVERQVGKLAHLVDDLLDLARIRRGAMELRRERVELSAVLDGAVESSRPLIERRGHRLLVEVPSAPVPLDADPHRLEQVITNLLNNAAKYTPPGGRIWLESRVQGEVVVLTVGDTGIGLLPGTESRLFEPFVQGEPTAETEGGLGIGLALVRGLVQLHGGEVAARSDGPGQGSEFTLRLPVLPSPPAPAVPLDRRDESGPVPARPLAVLIVEDEPDTALSLADLVEVWGHRPLTAADGAAGLAALALPEAPPPDVALLDLGLPGMDGCDLARQLRERLGPGLLLVALTGHGQDEDRRRTQEAGFDHHLVKPVDPATLRRLLAEWSSRPPPYTIGP